MTRRCICVAVVTDRNKKHEWQQAKNAQMRICQCRKKRSKPIKSHSSQKFIENNSNKTGTHGPKDVAKIWILSTQTSMAVLLPVKAAFLVCDGIINSKEHRSELGMQIFNRLGVGHFLKGNSVMQTRSILKMRKSFYDFCLSKC